MAGIGKALRGIGNVLKKYKNKESTADWVDRHTNPGEVKPGKILKNTLKGAGAAVGVGIGAEKISTHRRKKRRTRKAAGGILKGIGKIVKGPANKIRMEQAKNLKKHRLKSKIEKARAGREARKIVSDWDKKHVSSNPELKRAMSQERHPKSWRRQVTKKLKEIK